MILGLNGRKFRLLFSVLSLAALPSLAIAEAQRPEQQMADYFDMLVSGNYESASYMWSEAARERSTRFGIEFDNIVVKADCASPIVRNLSVMKDFLHQPVRKKAALGETNCFRTDFEALVLGQVVKHSYYLCFEKGYYWLTYPQEVYCSEWPVIESKYLRVHYHPSLESSLHSVILDEADKYVEMICDSLQMDQESMKLLGERKMEYFYCQNETMVEKITGFHIKGTVDLGSNDIISSFFPHYHEMVHLLVNIKLRKLPMYTVPLFREGIAVQLAGRWGKMSGALLELGSFVLQHEIIDLDSILTMSGFEENATSDIVYPVAGLISSYLIDEIGMEKYMNLYWAASWSFESIDALSEEQVRKLLITALGLETWDDFREGLAAYGEKRTTEYADMLPGAIEKGKRIVENEKMTIRADGTWISFECSAPPGTPVAGNVLFDEVEGLTGSKSELFEEQYQSEIPFESYRFGVRYDQNEAGLYDYATNHLVAKYIWGISPSELYFDSTANQVSFKVRKKLLDQKLPSQDHYKLLDY
ncbi:MAG: hypothetical protein P1R58_03225 [bacterium]|nr:hypothetical protein [bacterium]